MKKRSLLGNFLAKNRSKTRPARAEKKRKRLRLETLEERALLSVSAGEYAEIRAAYPDWGLPTSSSSLNVIEITADRLSLENLKTAIANAASSPQSDLIVVRTTDAANAITFETRDDNLKLTANATEYGETAIVALGTKPLTIDGAKKTRVMSVGAAASVKLGNVALANGYLSTYYDDIGGALYNGGSLALTNCAFVGSRADYGGALYNEGSLTATNVEFTSNSATYGGAFYSVGLGSATLTNGDFIENTATYGGAVYNGQNASLTIADAAFTKNTASSYGGAFYNAESGSIALTNVAISENVALYGAGIYNVGAATLTDGELSENAATRCGGGIYNSGDATLTDVVVSKNEAKYTANTSYVATYGGGVYNSGDLTLTNAAIWGNVSYSCNQYGYGGGIYNSNKMKALNVTVAGCRASSFGGGIYCGANAQTGLFNAIVALNVLPKGYDDIQRASSGTYDALDGSCVITNFTDWDVAEEIRAYSTTDPLFAVAPKFDASYTLANAGRVDLRLAADSIALDLGSSVYVVARTDLDGARRVQGGRVDLGAYEAKSVSTSQLASPNGLAATKTTDGSVSLTWKDANANETGYVVEYKKSVASTWTVLPPTAANAVAATVSGLASNVRYDFRVKAVGAGAYVDSDYSATVSATTSVGSIVAPDYDEIRAAYPEWNLPASPNDVNVVEIEANDLSVATLKTALAEAEKTTKPDLIVLRTTDISHRIRFDEKTDAISLDFDAEKYGEISIVAIGTRSLTLNAAGLCRVVKLGDDAAVELGNLTIRHGRVSANEYGAGICNAAGTLTLSRCAISQNVASSGDYAYGGGIYNESGKINLFNVELYGNSASADYASGGGLYNGGEATLTNVSLVKNAVSGSVAALGGGLYNGGLLTVVNAVFAANSAGIGGGLYNLGETTATNATIAGNKATKSGGGLYNDDGQATLRNAIVALNAGKSALNDVVAVRTTSGFVDGSRVLTNFTDWNASDGVWKYSTGETIFAVAPKFDAKFNLTNAESLDLRLPESSRAFDAGKNDYVPAGVATDLDGGKRIQGAAVDLGAYETTKPTLNAPLNLAVSSVGANSVALSWSDSNENETGYRVEYKSSQASEWSTFTTTAANATSVSVDGLDENAKYDFRVMAVGDGTYVDSEYSATVSATTLRLGLNAPTNLKIGAITSSSIALSWTDTNDREGGYQVEYKTSYATSWTLLATTAANATSVSATNLFANTKYQFRVKAVGDGTSVDSAYAATVSATTSKIALKKPSILTAAALGADSISLVWSDANNAESGYKVEYKKTSGSVWSVWTTTAANVATTVVAELQAQTTYQFRVKAVGSGGYADSPYSSIVSATTDAAQTALNAPANLTIGEVGTYCVTLTWDDVDDYEDGFAVEYKADGAANWTLFKTTVANVEAATVDGLLSATRYEFRVKAIGSGVYVDSSYSSIVSATTDAAQDDENRLASPTITSTEVGVNGILVRWRKSSGAASYTVRYRVVGSETFQTATVSVTKSACLLTDLEPGATYSIAVKADASSGCVDSEYSVPVEATARAFAAPTFLSGTPELGPNGILVKWNKVPSAAGYSVEYKIADSDAAFTVATVSASRASHIFKNVPSAASYTVRIKALGADGRPDSDYATVDVRAKKMAAPTISYLASTSKGVTLNWRKVYGAASYLVEYKAFGSSDEYVAASVSNANGFYVLSDVKALVIYSIRVKTVAKNACVDSDYVEIVTTAVETPRATVEPTAALDAAFADFTDDEDDLFDLL